MLEDVVEHDASIAYPLRTVSSITLNHVSLIINKCPIYKATSVELRDGLTRWQSSRFVAANADYRRRAAAAYKKQC